MNRVETVAEATFHPNLRWYRFLQGTGLLVGTVAGIVALPVWIPLGWAWARRYFETLECALGERSLAISYGVWFRTEKTIPLEQIQDVSVRHGPLLDWLGLTKLKIETAGQGASQQAAGDLVGVEEPVAFRDRILEQRERLSGRGSGGDGLARDTAGEGEIASLLAEIRDALVRIEERLGADG